MSKADLYDAVTAAGIEIDHHESDLYIRDTDQARQICRELDWRFTPFTADDGSGKWLDVPFAYAPYWEERA